MVSGGQERPAPAPDAGIDDHDMNAVFGKVAVGTVEKKGSFQNVLRSHPMTQIDDVDSRVDPEDDSFHDPHEGIGTPKIG